MARQYPQPQSGPEYAVSKPTAWMLAVVAILAWIPAVQLAAWHLRLARAPSWFGVWPVEWWSALAFAIFVAVMLATRKR